MKETSENTNINVLSLKKALGYTCFRENHVDLDEIDHNGYSGDMMLQAYEEQTTFNHCLDASVHFSLRHDGELLCVFGCTPIWPGLWEGFLLPTARMKNHPMASVRMVRSFIDKACIENGIVRLQATVDVKRQKGLRFSQKLGFKLETTLEKYGPDGQDHLLISKIFKD